MILGITQPKVQRPANPRLWRRFRRIEKLPAKERKLLLAVIDAYLERDKLIQKTG